MYSARSAGNLPAEQTSFVGRRHEADAVRRLLRHHQLVTLIGGTGVGKTRLALRVAADLKTSFADGAWLVELAALHDHRFLTQVVTDVLGVPDEPERAPHEALMEFVADRNLLLVLDNCEHLVDECAVLATGLLHAAPGLRILATSRQALRADGEWLFEVAPLPVPRAGGTPGQRPDRTDAMSLFAERAACARPGFTVNARNRAATAALCRRLEGIPLAIELAAVRVRAMPVEAILARLEHYDFETLEAGARVSVPRLQTLRAAIDWSHGLCSGTEQRLWARASVFSGGFDLDAAERVCSGAGIDEAEVIELIAGLVDKSVLISSAADGTVRYRMLETIREYGAQRLAASGEAPAVRTRHRDHFTALAQRVEQDLLTPGELPGLTRLWRDHANLRTALEFCLSEPGQARAGLETAGFLWHYWTITGHHREGRYWLDRTLSVDTEPSPARAKALAASGWLAFLLADWGTARSRVAECVALAARLEDATAGAHAAWLRGMDAFFCGDMHRAVELLEDALARMRALGDRTGTWMTLRHLALSTALVGDADRAEIFGKLSVDLAGTPGAPAARAWSLEMHGFAQWLTGHRERATELIRESLKAATSSSFINRWAVAHCLEVLAWDAAARDDSERAALLLGGAHAAWRSIATPTVHLRHLAAEHIRCERRTRAALTEQSFHKLFDEGARLTVDQVVDYALVGRR